MKILKLLIIAFILMSCSDLKENKSFDTIEYSLYMGYFRNIKINKDGKAYVSLNYKDPDHSDYYYFVFDKVKLDTLTNLINSLPSELERKYEASSADHPISFSFIINIGTDNIVTSYMGDYVEKELEPVFSLSNYLSSLIEKSTSDSDSVNVFRSAGDFDSLYVFKTKSRLILPPPPGF